jgi:hypothetical protein
MTVWIDLESSRATEFDENEFEVVLLFSLSGLTLSLCLFRLLDGAFALSLAG